jgi:hemerythrin-like domain-containing protein
MTPTKILRKEHGTIKRMLSILLKMCVRMEASERIDPGHLERIVETIRFFVYSSHHEKEENLLFPALEEIGIRKDWGALGVIISERDEVRKYLKLLSVAVDDYKKSKRGASSRVVKQARNFAPLFMAHIHKEDIGIFHAAESRLSLERQKRLTEEFEKAEQVVGIGFKRQRELMRFLFQFEKIYTG